MGLGSTYQNYVALYMQSDLRNLTAGMPYRWRVRLYQATPAGEVFLKASDWSPEPFTRK